MLHNRLFKMFGIAISLVLAVLTVLTVQAGLATKAVADRSYDSLEALRANRSAAAVRVDASNDMLDELQARRLAAAVRVDASNDMLDELQARRAWASAAAIYDAQRANAAYAARWQALAQAYAPH